MKLLTLVQQKTLAGSPSASSLEMSCKTEEFANFQQNFNNFKDKVKQGKLHKIAQFWPNYCDTVWT
jgi:hypothetical protein